MPNELITAQGIVRNALDILEPKLSFISTINRQYDDSYAGKGGAPKIGAQLKIRLPNQFTVRTGRNYSPQAIQEETVSLVLATQKGVDSEIYSDDLTLSMEDFRLSVLEPQMSQLAAIMEYDALEMAFDVYDATGTPGTTPGSVSGQALLPWLQAKQRLDENLVPTPRCVQMNGDASTYTVNGMSSLYNDSRTISKQMAEGFLLRNSGHDYYTNTLVRRLTNGTVDNTTPLVDGASQGGDGTLTLKGLDALATISKGQVLTLASVNAVHHNTKQSWGRLQQVTVTADATASAGGAVTLSISPRLVATGAKQNVSALPADEAAVTFAGTASTAYPVNIAYHRDAFAFVTCDLEVPKGMDMAYQTSKNGVNLRFLRWYDGDSDIWKSRFDVYYGFKTIRPMFATRIWG